MIIDELLGCEIVVVSQTSPEEINDLIKREEVISLAKTKFANNEISFQDYLDCLEVAGVCINEYRSIVNENCRVMGF